MALLVSQDQIADTKADWLLIEWAEPVVLPWDGHGVVLKGSYPPSVDLTASRQTASHAPAAKERRPDRMGGI